jgi:small subunit ribosomal protein S1
VAAEYQEHVGEHAYDDQGNYIGGAESTEAQQAWAEYYAEHGDEGMVPAAEGDEEAPAADGAVAEAEEAVADEAPAAE